MSLKAASVNSYMVEASAGHELSNGREFRPREISPSTGRALEMLGHAIEYLTDEYVHEAKRFCATDPQVAAIQLLKARNRELYYACPVVPTLIDRLRAYLHLATH